MLEQIVTQPEPWFALVGQRSEIRQNLRSVWPAPPHNVCLRTNELHVWHMRLEDEEPHLDTLWNRLSLDEQTRAQRFYSKGDCNNFIGTRGLLRTILARYLGTTPSALTFSYNQYGKPHLLVKEREETINFNVSHSRGRALFAFTRNGSVGVDIEHIRAHADLEAIAKRFFSVPEQAVLNKTPLAFRSDAFFTCWVRKESFIKAHGLGLSLPLDSFDVLSAPGRALWSNCDERSDRVSPWSIIDLPVDTGYKGALAAEIGALTVKCFSTESQHR